MRKVIRKRVRRSGAGVNLVADVNAVIAGNIGENNGVSRVSRSQTVRVVQRNGRTEVAGETPEG